MKQERSEDRIGKTMGRNGTLPIFEGGMSLHKRLKVTFNAPVTLGFVIMCFIATLLGVISNGKITQIGFMTYHSLLTNPMTYVRFITHIFGHSGWSHFIGNASYLLLLGPMLEEKYGSKELIEVIGIAVQDDISNMAHIVGGIIGSVIGYSLNRKK